MEGEECWRRAAQCAAAANETPNPHFRVFLTKVRDAWIEAANTRHVVDKDDHDGVLPASVAKIHNVAA
jgi:hypothetical protein